MGQKKDTDQNVMQYLTTEVRLKTEAEYPRWPTQLLCLYRFMRTYLPLNSCSLEAPESFVAFICGVPQIRLLALTPA